MPLGWLLKSATGEVGFPLIRIVDAAVTVVAPLVAKASIPFCPMSEENAWLTVMLVPDRVVIAADPGAVAKMRPS